MGTTYRGLEANPMTEVETLLVNVEQAAEALGIRRSTAWELVRRGELRSVKIGARRLVPVDGLREYAASLVQK